jgi:hypothetical protein
MMSWIQSIQQRLQKALPAGSLREYVNRIKNSALDYRDFRDRGFGLLDFSSQSRIVA